MPATKRRTKVFWTDGRDYANPGSTLLGEAGFREVRVPVDERGYPLVSAAEAYAHFVVYSGPFLRY